MLELAKNEFGSLLKAETRLFLAVADGEFADYTTGKPDEDDLADKGD